MEIQKFGSLFFYFIIILFIFVFFLFIYKVFLDLSVDVVLVVYCFYWFVNEEVVKEIYRVLILQGILGMIWVLLDELVFWLKEMMIFFYLLEEDFKYIILKEIMDKVFEEVGKFFMIEKELGKKIFWYFSYDGCYKYFVLKGIIQRGIDEVKCQFKIWFDYIIGKYFFNSEGKELIIFFLVYLICWCKKKKL